MTHWSQHADPRTARKPSLAEQQSGAACSVLQPCTRPNVSITSTRDGEYTRFRGLCVECGAIFYAVEA